MSAACPSPSLRPLVDGMRGPPAAARGYVLYPGSSSSSSTSSSSSSTAVAADARRAGGAQLASVVRAAFCGAPLLETGPPAPRAPAEAWAGVAAGPRETSTPTPTPRRSSSPASASGAGSTSPESPAMELSRARQSANRAQLSHVRGHPRDGRRGQARAAARAGGSGESSPGSSPGEGGGGRAPRRAGEGEEDGRAAAAVVPGGSGETRRAGRGAADTGAAPGAVAAVAVARPHECFQHAPPPPLWDAAKEGDGVHAELAATYRYPRLYLRDPGLGAPDDAADAPWRCRLARRLATTLRHAGDPRPGGRRPAGAPPADAWSEPAAAAVRVRGPTYPRDGAKVPSAPALFAVLGADSLLGDGARGEGGDGGGPPAIVARCARASRELGLAAAPFLLIIHFIVPWGSFQAYFIRPGADEGPFCSWHRGRPSEEAWRAFLHGSTDYRNARLKLIPRATAGPWLVRKAVGATPVLLGTKLPVSYRGSARENFLEVALDVTRGPAFGQGVANTVVARADAVTVDLGFVIEGREAAHLPEQLLGLIRLHHLDMKRAPTRAQWEREVSQSGGERPSTEGG